MPIYRGFYAGFNPRHEWNRDKTDIVHKVHEEHGDSWVALFIDLVYVAMFMSCGFILEYCGHKREVVAYAFVLFVIMFNSRLAIDTYSNRFFADDLFHRLVYCVYTLGVFIMTLNINYTYKPYYRRLAASTHQSIGDCPYVQEYWDGFAYGFFITRGCLVLLYACICYQNRGAYQQFSILLKGFLLSIIIAFVSVTFVHGTQKLYYATVLVEFLAMAMPRIIITLKDCGVRNIPTIPETYPKDVFEMQNRLGIFYMMTLGESMIQLLQRVYSTDRTEVVYRFTIFSFFLVFSYGMQYFDAVFRQRSVALHAMKRSSWSYLFFVWAHPILGFFSIYMTVGLTMMYISVLDGEEASSYFRKMLTFGAFAQTVLMIFMRMSHKGVMHSIRNPTRILYIFVRLAIAASHLCLRYYTGSDTNAVILQALIACCNNILDIAVAMKPEALRALHSFSSRAGELRATFFHSHSDAGVGKESESAAPDGIRMSPISDSSQA